MKYVTKNEILKHYPLTMEYLNYLLRQRDENGLDRAVKRIGGKIWIIKDEFEKWVESCPSDVNRYKPRKKKKHDI
jgi:hypothetical protein